MSTHELSRTRRRTHAALVAAARELVAEGLTPTVEDAAGPGGGVAHDGVPVLRQPGRPAGRRSPRGGDHVVPRRGRVRRPEGQARAGAGPVSRDPQGIGGAAADDAPTLARSRARRRAPVRAPAAPGTGHRLGGGGAGAARGHLARGRAAAARVRGAFRRRHRVAGVAPRRRRVLPRRGVRTAAVVGARPVRRGAPDGAAAVAATDILAKLESSVHTFRHGKYVSDPVRPVRGPRGRRVGAPAPHRFAADARVVLHHSRRGDRCPDRRRGVRTVG